MPVWHGTTILSVRKNGQVVMAGDGGLAVHIGELLTLAQERPWLVLLVFNDAGYGVLRNMQDAHGSPRSGVDLTTPDFGLLAQSLGLPFRRIGDASQVRTVLADAVAEGGSVVVEIDLAAYGEMPVPFTPPVHVPGAVTEATEPERSTR